jgi:hypothetical protein
VSEDQKRIIKEQLRANARMVQRNAERGVVYAHGQGPVNNERLDQARSFLMAAERQSKTDDDESIISSSRHK